MPEFREKHCAVTITDDRVAIIGGRDWGTDGDSGTAYNGLQIYDFEQDTWLTVCL